MQKGLLLLLFSLSFVSSSQGQDFKIIGYLLHARLGLMEQMDLEKLTHLNIAFLNPDANGDLYLPSGDLQAAIDRAHEANVEVFLSLAGGYLEPAWAASWEKWMLPENRSDFIHRIVQFTLDHDCQGVDVDLEWQYVNEKYSPFVLELADSIKAHGLQITAALPGTYRYPDITDEVLETYDWINMMAYDLRGPWAPGDPGPHSPISFAERSMEYWQRQGMPAEKLTLGVPFYGYDFSDPNRVRAYTYRTILSWDQANAQRDVSGQTYYNGIPTIQAKTRMAMEKLSGIMIWEIGQDDFGDHSLLDAIAQEILATSVVEGISPNLNILAYPNPFVEEVRISSPKIIRSIRVYNVQGQELKHFRGQGLSEMNLDLNDLSTGLYFIRLELDQMHTIQVFKR